MKRKAAKAPVRKAPGNPTLYEWVSGNNPAPEKEYGKGWWDSIEFYYYLLNEFPDCDARVVGAFVMQTPPPTEELLMPVVRLRLPTANVILKHDFSLLPPEWTVSVERKTRTQLPTYGLFDPKAAVPARDVAALPAARRFGTFAENSNRFCCQLDDHYYVFAFLRILNSGAKPTTPLKSRLQR